MTKKGGPSGGIAVTWGDPAGVGPEVTLKAFSKLPKRLRGRVTVFGDPDHFEWLSGRLGMDVAVEEATGPARAPGAMRVERTCRLKFAEKDFGKVRARTGKAAMAAVAAAARAAIAGKYGAVVTAPVNKEAANLAGYKIAGHTEYLAGLCGNVPVAMMLASKELKVVVATTHEPLRKVPAKLTSEKIARLLKLIHGSFTGMGLPGPRVAVCGLNPHASDGGLFGDEEQKVIAPAIRAAKRAGVDAAGPYPADAMFTPRFREKYDVALAMYHDQGLIPVKALASGKTVNMTLGLPFVRVSVDHGTAFDIAGAGQADAGPMIHAIRVADGVLRGKGLE